MNCSTIRKHMVVALSIALLSGCGTAGRFLNPFYESPGPEAYLGERSDRALNTNGNQAQSARQALDAMASYRRALPPEPTYPVMQPSVVRLMWIPDHLNKNGDLVAAHYSYVKVLNDRWAVQDAFEAEEQLGKSTSGANIPYIYATDQNQK